MPPDRSPPRCIHWARALLCLLVLGLLLHGQAGVLRHLLGAAHWHRPAALQASADATSLAAVLQTLQAWRQAVQARSPLVAGHAGVHHAGPGHHHHGSERHHHRQDTTVVVLEAGGVDPLADTLSGSLLQPLGLAAGLHCPGLSAATGCWPRAQPLAWRDAGLRLPERPPRG